MVGILQKTWGKMGDGGRAAALPHGPEEAALVGKAVAGCWQQAAGCRLGGAGHLSHGQQAGSCLGHADVVELGRQSGQLVC